MRRVLAKAVLASSMLVALPAMAQLAKPSPVATMMVRHAFAFPVMNERGARRDFVDAVRAYCDEIRSSAPTNTPAEDEWVRTESDTSDPARIQRLVASPEYARKSLQETVASCLSTTGYLRDAQAGPESKEAARIEAANLISLALLFDGDMRIYAVNAGLNPDRYRLDMLQRVHSSLLIAALRAVEAS